VSRQAQHVHGGDRRATKADCQQLIAITKTSEMNFGSGRAYWFRFIEVSFSNGAKTLRLHQKPLGRTSRQRVEHCPEKAKSSRRRFVASSNFHSFVGGLLSETFRPRVFR
jgi:hypothetical protein